MNYSAYLPPGATSSFNQKPDSDPRMAMSDRFKDPETVDKKLAKLNMTADQKRDMMREFQEMDTDRDGVISREELRNFFRTKGITDEL